MATLRQEIDKLSDETQDKIDEVLDAMANASSAQQKKDLEEQLSELEKEEDNIIGMRMRYTASQLAAAADPIARADLDLRHNALKKIGKALASILGTVIGVVDHEIHEEDDDHVVIDDQNGAVSAADEPTIQITDQDITILSTVTQSEVGHFGKYGDAVLEGAVKAVVDTIINRVAHTGFPSTIEAVVNQKKQFSAINASGTWTTLPSPKAKLVAIVTKHVEARSEGEASSIGGATHFLNPHQSSSSAMAAWGQFLVDHAIASFGDNAKGDIHFHGFPPNGKAPGGYVFSYNGHLSRFSGDGRALKAATASTPDEVVASALKEWDFWGKSTWNLITGKKFRKHRDDDPTFAKYVRDTYCPLMLSGGDLPSLADIEDDIFFWSAVTISYIIRQAGIPKDAFKVSASHSTYIVEAIKAKKNKDSTKAFWGYRIDDASVAPEPGDIIGYPRAKNMTKAKSLTYYDKTGWYGSHTDIVVAKRPGELDVIGGNVRDSVTLKTLKLDGNGRIDDPHHFWFVLMKKQ